MTQDRTKLFADITRSISTSGASIIGARLHTGKNARVMNVFYLQNPDGQAFGRQSDHVLEVLRLKAFKGASGEVNDMKIPKAIISNRAGAIPIVPNVSFFKKLSTFASSDKYKEASFNINESISLLVNMLCYFNINSL